MLNNLREAHDRNDEVLELIYIDRHFKNDIDQFRYDPKTANLIRP